MTTAAIGQWRPCGAVLVLVPEPPGPPPAITDLVACPLCRARLAEPCRTAGGSWTTHDVRLVSRRCPCGNRPREGSHFCTTECQDVARAKTYRRRERRTPTRERRKSA